MKILFLGTGEFGVPTLRALAQAGHEIVAAVSQPDRPAGRGLTLAPTPIRAAAEALGIPHVQTADVNALPPAELLHGAELGFVVAFGQKLGPRLLAALPRGCVNLHGSLLPRHRGAAPVQWALLAGDETTGVTLFQLNERWDAGPIWATAETPIGETETADDLHDRLAALGAPLSVETIAGLDAGTLAARAQDAARATRAPKLRKADGFVEFAAPARQVARRVNGLWSWPAAACEFVSAAGKRERVLLARARGVAETQATEGAPGTILADYTVRAEPGRVQVLEIKPAGGRLMSFDAFVRGRRVRPGDRFVRPENP